MKVLRLLVGDDLITFPTRSVKFLIQQPHLDKYFVRIDGMNRDLALTAEQCEHLLASLEVENVPKGVIFE